MLGLFFVCLVGFFVVCCVLVFFCESGIWQTVWTEPLPGHSLTYKHDNTTKPWPCKLCLSHARLSSCLCVN